jgi:hypothetical protein
VSGILSHQSPKCSELVDDFSSDGRLIIKRDHVVQLSPFAPPELPFAEIDVQADAEGPRHPGACRGRFGRGPPDHQAGAGHDALLVAAHDAVVDAGAQTEVVGIDDQAASPILEQGCHVRP